VITTITKARRLAAFFLVVVLGLVSAARLAHAQDMEPRAYSASPINTNFLVATYANAAGAASLDPALPISNVRGIVNSGFIGYDRTFDLFGNQASAAILIPAVKAHLRGDVFDASREITRLGMGDMLMRVTENLIGGPALTPAEFMQRQPSTTAGVSLTAVAPTGDYNPQHLINISSHRWSFKPEVGFSQPIDNWFVDGSAGVWLHTDNSDFFGGRARGQEPLWTTQAHAGYNFRPGLWLAADFTHYFGGDTVLNGVNNQDFQSVTRYGATLSVPIIDGLQTKLAWASWLTAHNGGRFSTWIFTLQYRWFDS
jgi:hypothetical protein